VEDIAGMDLLDTELVVLSSESSGLGGAQALEMVPRPARRWREGDRQTASNTFRFETVPPRAPVWRRAVRWLVGALSRRNRPTAGPCDAPADDWAHALRRAFVLAGAKTVVMNLWGVPCARTVELLEDFYRRLLGGQPRAHALREAQLAARARHPDPLHWAGFICLGDGSPLPEDCARTLTAYRPFVPADDPYVAGVPVAGKLFVGRADVLQMIHNNLVPAAGKNILVLRGQRRTGKTSVLLRLRDTLPEESGGLYLPALVSLQGLAMVQGEGAFFYHLARRIQLELGHHGVKVPAPAREDFDRDLTEAFELDFLGRLTEALGRRQVLLMLDEFEMLRGAIDQGRLGSQVLEYFRHLMQHTPLLFLIAGTHKLRELTGA
jgi:hypothetical protein